MARSASIKTPTARVFRRGHIKRKHVCAETPVGVLGGAGGAGVEWLIVLKQQLLLEGLTLAKGSSIFIGKMCVFVHVTFRVENGVSPNWVVGFLQEKQHS